MSLLTAGSNHISLVVIEIYQAGPKCRQKRRWAGIIQNELIKQIIRLREFRQGESKAESLGNW